MRVHGFASCLLLRSDKVVTMCRRFFTITAFVISYLLYSLQPLFADVGIEATLQPTRISVGQPATLTITVSGANDKVSPPELPKLPNFRSYSQGRSQEITIINGKMDSRNVFSYVLIPTLSGKHVLGQLDVRIGSKVYKTGVLEIEVDEASKGSTAAGQTSPRSAVVPPAPRSLPPEYLAGEEVFVRAWVDKEDVYINEPIYLTYTVYTRVNATFRGFETEPTTTGFWVEEFPPQLSQNRQEKDIGGYRYVVADVRVMALFPTEPGKIFIDPGDLKVDVEIMRRDRNFDSFQSNDIFGWRRNRMPRFTRQVVPRTLSTSRIEINVKPFPRKDKPDNFNGAVGRYQMEADVDRHQVEEGEPITLKFTISGEGNLSTLQLPKVPDLEYFKSYDASNAVNLKKDRLVVEGEKIQEVVLIPKKAGAFTVPALEFSYFVPGLKKFKMIKTKPIILSVKPSTDETPPPLTLGPKVPSQPVALMGEDIRFVKPLPGVPMKILEPMILKKGYLYANAGVLALSIMFLIIKLLSERNLPSVSNLRMKKAMRDSKKEFRNARRFMRKGLNQEFHESISKAFSAYWAAKFKWEITAVDQTSLESFLKDKLTDGEQKELNQIFSSIHVGRFTQSKVADEEMKKLFDACERFLKQMDKKKL
jgi:hypothetical protein